MTLEFPYVAYIYPVYLNLLSVIIIFVMRLIYIGGNMPSRILMIQLIVGSWLLLTLVLVNIYNGTLISYLTITRRDKPLINSPDDIVANSNLHLVVNKGKASDLLLSVWNPLPYRRIL